MASTGAHNTTPVPAVTTARAVATHAPRTAVTTDSESAAAFSPFERLALLFEKARRQKAAERPRSKVGDGAFHSLLGFFFSRNG